MWFSAGPTTVDKTSPNSPDHSCVDGGYGECNCYLCYSDFMEESLITGKKDTFTSSLCLTWSLEGTFSRSALILDPS